MKFSFSLLWKIFWLMRSYICLLCNVLDIQYHDAFTLIDGIVMKTEWLVCSDVNPVLSGLCGVMVGVVPCNWRVLGSDLNLATAVTLDELYLLLVVESQLDLPWLQRIPSSNTMVVLNWVCTKLCRLSTVFLLLKQLVKIVINLYENIQDLFLLLWTDIRRNLFSIFLKSSVSVVVCTWNEVNRAWNVTCSYSICWFYV